MVYELYQIHELKLIRRQDYGRVDFDLYRLQVLHGPRAPVKKSHLGQFDQKSWNLLALAAHVACQDKKNSGGTGVLPMRETLHRLVLRPQQEKPQWLVFSSGLFAEMSSATPARIRSSPNVKANSGL
jgi:hypothetical protein